MHGHVDLGSCATVTVHWSPAAVWWARSLDAESGWATGTVDISPGGLSIAS
jgi:hypothetical protein